MEDLSLECKHHVEEVKQMEKRATKLLSLATIIAIITISGGLLIYTTKCSGPAPVAQPTTPPAPTACADGAPIGATKNVACPAGQTGSSTQICTANGWLDAINTCKGTNPTCTQTTFTTIQPTLQQFCAGCHAQITTYSFAQSWSAEIGRRVGLPTGNNDHMPQGTAPQLNNAQVSSIQKWVTDGAIQDCSQQKPPAFLDLNYINSAMVANASALSIADRPFTRYLITSHAANAGITGAALNVWSQAVNKALNGLNNQTQDIFKVQAIEPTGTVLRVDLRTFGISTAAQIALLDGGDTNLNIVDNTSQGVVLQTLIGSKHPWFHADNFVDFSHRNSAVYYGLLGTPKTLAGLQAQQGVNFQNNLATLNLNFIGSASSPIAEQKNRLIVRDVEARSANSYYWQTFDVNAVPNIKVVNGVNQNTKNLFQFPLLPGAGAAVATPAVATFTSDASEVIYTLPNGMQGYALFDAVGNLLNDADPNVVIDTLTPLGNKVINASNSCGRCHNQGTIPMNDQILASTIANKSQFTANDVALVQALYKAAGADSNFFKKDNSVFAQALTSAGVDPNAPDPMSVITDRYLQNWDITMIGSLLFLTKDQITTAINTSPTALAQIGGLLAPGGTVTFQQFIAVLPQLIKDARLFQDPLGN
jgi:hypothetical protein